MHNLIKHIDVPLKHYHKSIVDNKDVSKYVMMMSSALSTLKPEVTDALQRYSDYSFLWKQDRVEAVKVKYHCIIYHIMHMVQIGRWVSFCLSFCSPFKIFNFLSNF